MLATNLSVSISFHPPAADKNASKAALVFARFFLGERLVSVGMRTATGLLFLTSLRGFFVASTSLTRRIRSGILDISIGVGSDVIAEQLYHIAA